MVRVIVMLVLTFLAGVAVLESVEAARFSMYCSDAAFIRAASLSRWETR